MNSGLRVGVYIDGFNLFYGGCKLCPHDHSWKWLDLRGLLESVISRQAGWHPFVIERIVYCTTQVSGDPESLARQQRYLLALRQHRSVDQIVFGEFRSSVRESPVAVKGPTGPVVIRAEADPLPEEPWIRWEPADGRLLVRHRRRDEKGSDVNVAAHLLIDVLEGKVDAAVVVSNDSDLHTAVAHARTRVPIGTVNPRGRPTAGKLKAESATGAGRHWWYSLTGEDLLDAQLPDVVGKFRRPQEWSRVED